MFKIQTTTMHIVRLLRDECLQNVIREERLLSDKNCQAILKHLIEIQCISMCSSYCKEKKIIPIKSGIVS